MESIEVSKPKEYSIRDIFSHPELVWFGLDFSYSRLIGAYGFTNPKEIKERYFGAWNRLFLTERQKFNLNLFLRKQEVKYAIKTIEKRNEACDIDSMIVETSYSFDSATVQQIVNEYEIADFSEGIGLVFIVESFNRFNVKAYVYVTFFDIASKKVLLTGRLDGKARGFGIRNYWMGAIFQILQYVSKSYPKWAKQYAN